MYIFFVEMWQYDIQRYIVHNNYLFKNHYHTLLYIDIYEYYVILKCILLKGFMFILLSIINSIFHCNKITQNH